MIDKIDMMKDWQPRLFARLCNNMRKECKRNGGFEIQKEQGYDFEKLEDIYLYIADIVLEGLDYKIGGVSEWARERSNGPSIYRGDARERMCNFFYGNYEFLDIKEEQENMDKIYSEFVKERVFTVHQAIVNYLGNEESNEEEFWKMDRVLDENRIAIPDEVCVIFESFITQYLEENLFGKVMRKDREGDIDLSYIKNGKLKEWSNLKDMPQLKEWFQLRNLYDIVSEQYIKPILQG